MFVTCPNCDAPLETLTATCPYCYKALRPWSMNSPWVMPVLIAFVCLVLSVIAIDSFADLGILKWVGDKVGPKDKETPWIKRQH